MVRYFYLSRPLIAAERSYVEGNESAASISGVLGVLHVVWDNRRIQCLTW